jgi:hypothetical protein
MWHEEKDGEGYLQHERYEQSDNVTSCIALLNHSHHHVEIFEAQVAGSSFP